MQTRKQKTLTAKHSTIKVATPKVLMANNVQCRERFRRLVLKMIEKVIGEPFRAIKTEEKTQRPKKVHAY